MELVIQTFVLIGIIWFLYKVVCWEFVEPTKAAKKYVQIDCEITDDNAISAAEKASMLLIQEGLFDAEYLPSIYRADNYDHGISQTYIRKKRTQRQKDKRNQEILSQFQSEDNFANDDVWSP